MEIRVVPGEIEEERSNKSRARALGCIESRDGRGSMGTPIAAVVGEIAKPGELAVGLVDEGPEELGDGDGALRHTREASEVGGLGGEGYLGRAVGRLEEGGEGTRVSGLVSVRFIACRASRVPVSKDRHRSSARQKWKLRTVGENLIRLLPLF